MNFFYQSNHKVTLAVKAIMAAFYGAPVKYAYFDGCSSGGPVAATFDFVSELMAWVEDQKAPGERIVSYRTSGDAASAVTRARPVYPYPAVSRYSGQGDVNSAASYTAGPATPGVSDTLAWAGLSHYKASEQAWCQVKAASGTSTLECKPMRRP